MFFSEESSNWWFVDFRHFLVPAGLHWINLTLSYLHRNLMHRRPRVWIRLWNYEALFEPSMKLFRHITHRAARKCSTIFQFTSSILNWIIFVLSLLSGIAPRKQMLSVIQYTIVDFPPERSYEKREFFLHVWFTTPQCTHNVEWVICGLKNADTMSWPVTIWEKRERVCGKKNRRIRSRTTGLTFRPSTRPIDINYWKMLAGGGS